MLVLGFAGKLDDNGEPDDNIILLIIPLYIFMIWSGLAISVKRWHDRDKSAWWLLISFVPIIGAIWAFIENGCLRGTEGANSYGDDPT